MHSCPWWVRQGRASFVTEEPLSYSASADSVIAPLPTLSRTGREGVPRLDGPQELIPTSLELCVIFADDGQYNNIVHVSMGSIVSVIYRVECRVSIAM